MSLLRVWLRVCVEVLDGRIVGTLPSKTSPTNQGKLCIKGWNVHEFIQHPDRLKKPSLETGSFREASWDEGAGYAARELRRIRDAYGPEASGFSPRPGAPTKRTISCKSRAHRHRQQQRGPLRAPLTRPHVAGLALAFGSGAMTNSFDELEDADCIFAIGSNTTVAHPIVSTRLMRARAKGNKLIVVDPERPM